MPILELRKISFSWDRRRRDWLHALDLNIFGGQLSGLIGKNGAGKTTLMKLMVGALRPQEGSILFGPHGLDVSKRSPDTLQEIVWVPESTDFPFATAIQYGRLAGALYPRFSFENFRRNLASLEVPEKTKLPLLSFGQKRKAHIAFALATQATLTILDEPTNGIDIAAQVSLRKILIESLTPERSLVVSTHHIREFENVLDNLIVLNDGSILAQRPCSEIQQDADFSGLEMWYTKVLQGQHNQTHSTVGGTSRGNI